MLRRLISASIGLALAAAPIALLPGGADAAPAASIASTATAAASDADAPSGLSVNGIAKPVDVEGTPAFGWHDGVARQTAYQIVVASTAARAAAGDGDLWDSGKVAGAQQRGIDYAGSGLSAAERYYWAVRTWDADDAVTAWSDVAQFGTGTGWSDSSPIWVPTVQNWTDYTFETDFTVVANAASVLFHATSSSSFYLWQIRSTGASSDPNTLKTHYGTTAIDTTSLSDFGLTIANNTTHHLAIEIEGGTVRTYIDDVLVRTGTNHSTYPSGGIGFRTGSSEQATFDNVVVTDPDGDILYSNDFSSDVAEMPTLSVSGGKLVVGTSKLDYIGGSWANYTYSADLTVTAVATGLRFRTDESGNGYMWQFRGADNTIVPHKQTSGTYATLGSTVSLPSGTLAIGKTVHVAISVVGTTIKTSIDGTLVSTVTDSSYRRGYVGVRTGNTETGTVDNVSVVDYRSGATLLSDDFATGNTAFACGTASGGALAVPTASNCLISAVSANWAFLRTDVDLADKPIAWGALFATGANAKTAKQYVHKVYVNGEFVGLGPTQPIGSETRYDGYDVTDLLRSGETNAVGALAYTTNTQKFQAELVVEYADGSRDVFGTDDSWTALNGNAVYPAVGSIGTSYYVAPKENLDARAFPWGWDEPGYDDSSWGAAAKQSSIGTLTATPTDKVRQELKDPASITQLDDGSYVVDFGRTWIGGVHYTVDGTSGAQVDLRFGEVKNSDGSVKYNLATSNSYQDVVTLDGTERTIDTWGARVFRYVQIVGAPEPVTADNLQALAMVYPFDASASTFRSSDADLVSVYNLAKNTIEALNLNFYTDSWTRERTNYEADGYLQQMSTLYLMDDLSLARYSMDYFKNNRTWPTEWPIYIVLAVRDAWRQTGDTSQMAAYYSVLQDKLPTEWIDSTTGLVGKTSGSNGCSSSTDCDIVDWPTSERDGYVFKKFNTVVNALSYRAYRDMAEIATALGKDADASTYTSYADRIRSAMNTRLYDASTGSYDDGLDASLVKSGHAALHASAFALAFGVPANDQRQTVSDYVASKGMRCSVYCAAFLVQGLYAGDNGQAALDMLTTGTGVRSWLHMIEQGAGATMEAWDPSLKSNLTYSHPWAASPAFNVPSGLFGIAPDSAGYATFTIKPQPGDLDWAAITTPTVRGSIGAAFDHSDGGDLRVVASVPGNTKATVSLPTAETEPTVVYVDGVARTVTPADGYLTVARVSPGCHLVTTEAGAAVGDRLTSVCTEALATGPAISGTVSQQQSSGWAGIGATLTLEAEQAPEDAEIEYRLPDGAWTTYAAPVTLAEGSYDVDVRLVDQGDVVASDAVPVRVDLTTPTVVVAVASEAGRSTLRFTATDAQSGVDRIEYRLDGGDWSTTTGTVVVDAVGDHVVDYRAVDYAGNASTPWSRSFTVTTTGEPGSVDPEIVTPPVVSGSAVAGAVLRSTVGTWNVDDLDLSRQWLRDGTAIDGATGETYRLTATDVGARLSVRVTAKRAGAAVGHADSAETDRVAKASSTTSATWAKSQVRKGKKVKVSVQVGVTGLTATGRVQIVVDGRVAKTVRLRDGAVTTKVGLGKRGKHRVKVRYLGSAAVVGSSSSAHRIKVV